MDSPQFCLDWGRVQKLLEERHGCDVQVPVEPPPLRSLPAVLPPPPRLSPPPRAPDSIAPAVMSHYPLAATQQPRRLGWVVLGAVILSASVLAAAVVRIAARTEPTASTPQAVTVAAAAPNVDSEPPHATSPAPEVPVVSVEKLPQAKGSKPSKPTKSKKRH